MNLFSVPFFIDKVDLEKINLIDESLEPTFNDLHINDLNINDLNINELATNIS